MAKGRKCLPTITKQAQGTLKTERANPNEPKYGLIKNLPEAPEYLTESAKGLYYSIGLELSDKGILTSVSLDLFVKYCTVSAEASEAYKEYLKSPTITTARGETVSPFFRIWQETITLSLRIAAEFGITPASSSKVKSIEVKTSKLDMYIN